MSIDVYSCVDVKILGPRKLIEETYSLWSMACTGSAHEATCDNVSLKIKDKTIYLGTYNTLQGLKLVYEALIVSRLQHESLPCLLKNLLCETHLSGAVKVLH